MKTNKFLLFLLAFSPIFTQAESGRLSQILEQSRSSRAECAFRELAQESTQESFRGLESFSGVEIDTGRFKLRPVTEADFEPIKKIWGNEDVAKMSGDYLNDYTIHGLIAQGDPNFKSFRFGTIVNMGIYEGDKMIGMCQLCSTTPERPMMKGLAKPNENWAEISYHLSPDAWGKGVATEVASALVKKAINDLNVDGVHAQAIMSNEGSQKVLQKAGLVEIDRFKDPAPWSQTGGSVYFAITKAQYLENQKTISGQ